MTLPVGSPPVVRPQLRRYHSLPARALPAVDGAAALPLHSPHVAGSILGSYTRWSEHRLRSVDGAVARDVSFPVHGRMCTVRYWETRRGGPLPTLVILHGMGGMAATHRPLFSALSAQCRRAVFLEIPGHGGSEGVGEHRGPPPAQPYRCAELVNTIVRRALNHVLEDETQVLLFGHSLGGYLAARYAREAEKPQRIRGVVLVSPDGGPYSTQALAQARVEADVGDSLMKANAMARHIWPGQHYKAWGMAPFLQATYADPSIRYLLNSDLFAPALIPWQLGTLPTSCLVWGKAEQMQLPAHLNFFRSHLPPGTMVVQPQGFGHGDAADAPAALMVPVLQFLQRCSHNAQPGISSP